LPPDHPSIDDIFKNIFIAAGDSVIVSISMRSYPQCADGSCSQSIVKLQGTFQNGDPALACISSGLSVNSAASSHIPTLSAWGLIILCLLLLSFASISIVRQRQTALVTSNGMNINLKNPLFDAKQFRRIALISIPFILVAIALISLIEGGVFARDIIGVIISGLIISFLIQFLINSEQNAIEK